MKLMRLIGGLVANDGGDSKKEKYNYFSFQLNTIIISCIFIAFYIFMCTIIMMMMMMTLPLICFLVSVRTPLYTLCRAAHRERGDAHLARCAVR